jgi:hypothetical protein
MPLERAWARPSAAYARACRMSRPATCGSARPKRSSHTARATCPAARGACRGRAPRSRGRCYPENRSRRARALVAHEVVEATVRPLRVCEEGEIDAAEPQRLAACEVRDDERAGDVVRAIAFAAVRDVVRRVLVDADVVGQRPQMFERRMCAASRAVLRRPNERGRRARGVRQTRSRHHILEEPAVFARDVRPRHLAAEAVGAALGGMRAARIVEQRADRRSRSPRRRGTGRGSRARSRAALGVEVRRRDDGLAADRRRTRACRSRSAPG